MCVVVYFELEKFRCFMATFQNRGVARIFPWGEAGGGSDFLEKCSLGHTNECYIEV